ncbi:hypothetical protein PAERUG_E10_London_26_VIM_2_06_13_02832 [Pseudomonas aeruginosa]|nr:hypothetical protein PAERUG_E10_London_26_VIM_2_06_13_02832 [Pseudomonas aeruginosa]CRR61343.1 hypothetical protein PAERUG_P45_London_17_VIM_2_12_12_04788 [Pseudomonas aeruginosa]CRR73614.1 hypothetical protein PAERUG_E16_London_17_VIM_2_04_14_06576 [Pseudomonas aeruginosa]
MWLSWLPAFSSWMNTLMFEGFSWPIGTSQFSDQLPRAWRV